MPEQMKYNAVLLFGAPGSGKGTQGRILRNLPNCYYFACGDAFRNLRPDDPLGKTFLEYSSRGELVPDEFTITLWQKNMESAIVKGAFHPKQDFLVLDGIPRNPHQVEMIGEHVNVLAVLHLACPDQEQMIERIQRRALLESRLDDANLEVIRQRFQTYKQETQPVLDCFDADIVYDIDSTQSPVKVLGGVAEALGQLEFCN